MHMRAAGALCEHLRRGWGLQGKGRLRALRTAAPGHSRAGTIHQPQSLPAARLSCVAVSATPVSGVEQLGKSSGFHEQHEGQPGWGLCEGLPCLQEPWKLSHALCVWHDILALMMQNPCFYCTSFMPTALCVPMRTTVPAPPPTADTRPPPAQCLSSTGFKSDLTR